MAYIILKLLLILHMYSLVFDGVVGIYVVGCGFMLALLFLITCRYLLLVGGYLDVSMGLLPNIRESAVSLSGMECNLLIMCWSC